MHRSLKRQLEAYLNDDTRELSLADGELRTLLQAIAHHAYHDEQTGLPTRPLLVDRLARAVAHMEEHGNPFTVVAIALDNYNKVDDSFGHAACEAWTKILAENVVALSSPVDTLARIRKDVLCFLIESEPELAQVLRLTDRIQDEVQKPITIEGEEMFTTVSLGIVSSEGPTRAPEDYLHDAGVALNRASDAGGGRRAVFDLMMHQDVVRELNLEKELRQAIARDEFVVHYQPIVSLRNGAVAGFEALLRWQHPERGLVAPAQFIDTAESTGLLGAIFDSVLPRILEQAQSWGMRSRGPAPFVNINLSRKQFSDPDLLPSLDRALAQVEVAPLTVGFEMTESVMADDERVAELLAALKQRGARLLIDDFGTGYSCLANLKQFPLDSLKIDKSFIAEVGTKSSGGEIARAIVALAHGLAMEVTVEGIETEAQLRFAYGLGCEYGQGYHFSRPVPAEEAARTITRGYRTSLTPPSSGKRPKRKSRGRVLLVDSDFERQASMTRKLQAGGLDVQLAVNGHDGISKAEAEMPDVIIVVADLPGMGCVEACRRLQAGTDTANIPLLLQTTSTTGPPLVVEALEAGAADCIRGTTQRQLLFARIDAQVAMSRARLKLQTMAMTDEQTGVFSRRFLFQALRRAIKATVRSAPRGLACLVIDADGFKQVNETRGHIAADELLQRIATTIDATTRETDIVARSGGEEFIVLLQDTNREGAKRAAEKIRNAVASNCGTTVSIGGAILPDASVESVRTTQAVDDLISAMLRQADAAMYMAKKLGRNRVVFEDDAATHIA